MKLYTITAFALSLIAPVLAISISDRSVVVDPRGMVFAVLTT
jgi:hypothetical protein